MQKGVDYIAIGVSYYCHDGEGNYVLSKRSINCRDEHGAWDFGGGGLDFGMTVEETLKKELKEEYCVENFEAEFLGYYDSFREQNGQNTHWLQLLFLVKVDPKEVRNGEPHKFDAVEWFRMDNLPSPIHSMFHPQIKNFIHKFPK